MLSEGVPVVTAMAKLRPCTAAEILAYQVLARGFVMRQADQQGFIDQRRAPGRSDDIDEDDAESEQSDGDVGTDYVSGHDVGAEEEGPSSYDPGTVVVDLPALPRIRGFAAEDVTRNVRPRLDTEQRMESRAAGSMDLLDHWTRTGATGRGADLLA